MTEAQARALIEAYVAAYNAFDVDAMMATLHEDAAFQHLENGAPLVTADGKPEFRALAERAVEVFAERAQSILGVEHRPGETIARIEYRAVPRGGDAITGLGQTRFTFRDGRILSVTDSALEA